jgi:hypothetical protein
MLMLSLYMSGNYPSFASNFSHLTNYHTLRSVHHITTPLPQPCAPSPPSSPHAPPKSTVDTCIHTHKPQISTCTTDNTCLCSVFRDLLDSCPDDVDKFAAQGLDGTYCEASGAATTTRSKASAGTGVGRLGIGRAGGAVLVAVLVGFL